MDTAETMSELLARLKVDDTELWEEIRRRCIYDEAADFEIYEHDQTFQENIDDTIQGCIQRAIAERGWYWRIFTKGEYAVSGEQIRFLGYEADVGMIDDTHDVAGNSPASALLAAYLKAVEA